jgi:hypothetical protein
MKLFERVYQCPCCRVWHGAQEGAVKCMEACEKAQPQLRNNARIVMGFKCNLCKTISYIQAHDCKGVRW